MSETLILRLKRHVVALGLHEERLTPTLRKLMDDLLQAVEVLEGKGDRLARALYDRDGQLSGEGVDAAAAWENQPEQVRGYWRREAVRVALLMARPTEPVLPDLDPGQQGVS